MNTSIETITANLDIDLSSRISVVNEIINQAVYFDARSDESGRRYSGSITAPQELLEERVLVVPGQFMGTAKNMIATNAAIAEATGLVVVGFELPNHGDTFKLIKTERESVRHGDFEWLANDYSAILEANNLVAQYDSNKRYAFGISAGALIAAKMIEHDSYGRYEKVAFLDPANLVQRNMYNNIVSTIRENYFETGQAEEILGRFNDGLETPDTPRSLQDVSTFLHTFNNYRWHGETGQSIVNFLAKNPDIEVSIRVTSEGRVNTRAELREFSKYRSRSAKLAEKLSVDNITGINHNIGRYPLVVGQIAAGALVYNQDETKI